MTKTIHDSSWIFRSYWRIFIITDGIRNPHKKMFSFFFFKPPSYSYKCLHVTGVVALWGLNQQPLTGQAKQLVWCVWCSVCGEAEFEILSSADFRGSTWTLATDWLFRPCSRVPLDSRHDGVLWSCKRRDRGDSMRSSLKIWALPLLRPSSCSAAFLLQLKHRR